ncbi:murein biosynthesis integral membrane protein MurJ, partial [bacterium]|nr:murein biosynthesis integral membrane protein MurJ [bacterium]
MSSRKIVKAISIISLGTIISRIFGLAREVITASFFGTTGIYDAFLLAFMIPNFFRGILAEGALNSAFIPVFTEYLSDEKKKEETSKIVNLCFTLSLILTLSLFFLVFTLSYVAENFVSSGSRWFWVFILIKFTFPYLIFISLAALNMGILNSYKHFLLPSFSPVVLDIFWISSLFFLVPLFGTTLEEKIFGLCFGVIAGGIGQFLFMLPAVRRRGYRLRLSFNFNHPAVKKMGKLLAPVIIGVAVVPINLLVDYSLANFLYEGAVSGLWYATRIFQLPLGVFAISISTAVLPWFSENISSKNYEEFRKNFLFSIKLLFLLMIPFTFGLIFFRKEVVSFLFQRGMFTLHSVSLVS